MVVVRRMSAEMRNLVSGMIFWAQDLFVENLVKGFAPRCGTR